MLQLDHQDVETGDGEEEPWRAVRQRRPGAKPVEAISGLFSQVSTLGNNLSRAIPGAEDRRQGARPRSRRRGLVVEAAEGGCRRRGGHLGLVLQQSSSAFRQRHPLAGWPAHTTGLSIHGPHCSLGCYLGFQAHATHQFDLLR